MGKLLTRRAQIDPDKTALVFEGREFSFRELNQRSNQWANAFLSLGLKKGDRVGILLHNCVEYLEAYFGLAKIGGVLVLLNVRLSPTELEYICRNSGLSFLIYGQDFQQDAELLLSNLKVTDCISIGPAPTRAAKDMDFIRKFPSTEPGFRAGADDPVIIIHSSGTTGRPKGAVIPHSNLFWVCVNWLLPSDLTSQDRVLVVLPLFHKLGLICPGALTIYKGCTSVMMRSFDPHQMLETVRKERISMLFCVPTMLHRLLEVAEFEKYLRDVRIFVGAGPLPTTTVNTCLAHGLRLGLTYGLLEAGDGTIIGPEELSKKPDSSGLPFVLNEIRIVNEQGVEVPNGEVGELLITGPTVMNGYWNNPKATAEIIEAGWVHTGDLARTDEDGYLYVVGRKKDMILSGGEHIYPVELETLLEGHPKVAEVAVLGQADETWGEAACAVIRLKPGQKLTIEEIRAFCEGKIAHFKIPRNAIFTDKALPRNQMGKVVKHALRDQLRAEGRLR